jgi:DNA-binding MarR family transcriptional regulator
VIKRLHPSDGRAVLVQLTRRGRKVADQLIDAVALADEAALADLSVSDLPTADKLLTRLQAGIESAMSIQQEMRSGTEAPGRSSGVSRQ